MAGSRQIAGTIHFKVSGLQFPIAQNFSVAPQKTVRTAVTALSGQVYYKEETHAPYAEGDIFITNEVSVKEIEDLKDETVTVDLVTGHTYILSNAWSANEIVHNLAEGTAGIRFEGADCKEIK